MISVSRMLDKAKKNHGLASDYKLALVMGVSQSTLANYRTGKTLPDARIVASICELSNEDSALIAVEIEALKAKTPAEKKLWLTVASRMQMGFASVAIMSMLAICLIAGSALPSLATGSFASLSKSLSVYYVKDALRRLSYFFALFVSVGKRVSLFCNLGKFVGFEVANVPRHAHAAA